jgi:hypothetical protein
MLFVLLGLGLVVVLVERTLCVVVGVDGSMKRCSENMKGQNKKRKVRRRRVNREGSE